MNEHPKNYLQLSDRKLVGQYFTGTRLARALASVARADQASSILDPMAGTGDMIVACSQVGAQPDRVGAIELVPPTAADCADRVGGLARHVYVETGSAFDPRCWRSLVDCWDLVITNPPYVRYQSQRTHRSVDVDLPTPEAVRSGLVESLKRTQSLNDRERNVFVQAARHYSGLSDLAVPSWILAASRVAIGGCLAVVVPDTWLTRNYAASVVGLLRRFFHIEAVIHDTDACWFEDALVRTTLVVARRVPDKKSFLIPNRHVIVRVPRSAQSTKSIVGAAFSVDEPDRAFATWILDADHPKKAPLVSEWSDESDLIAMIQRASHRLPWISQDGNRARVSDTEPLVPERIRSAVGHRGLSELTDLAGLGWCVGQGLRTGANDFFYVTGWPDGSFTSSLLSADRLDLPHSVVRSAIRRQSDVNNMDQSRDNGQTGVLYLDGWALQDDAYNAKWQLIGDDLAYLIDVASRKTYSRGSRAVPLPQLSAVKTNVRPGRYWYHLPPLAKRHVPHVFLPRVNNRSPQPHLNTVDATGKRRVIDANFTTLWINETSSRHISRFALIALLSSTWTLAIFESIGTTMGGGALKIEATHLRRLPLPNVDCDCEERLSSIGQLVVKNGLTPKLRDAIDRQMEDLLNVPGARMSNLSQLLVESLGARVRRPQRRDSTPTESALFGDYIDG